MTSCAVFIPVLGRPHRVEPLVASLAASQPPIAVHPVFVCSPGDADEIAAVRAAALEPLIADWDPDRGDYAKKMNYAWGHTTDEFVFLGADDLVFHPGWLTAALAVQVGACACVVGTNDLGNSRVTAGRHSTHSLVHREYGQWGTIDDPSKLLHEQYDHQFCNTPDAPVWMADLSFKTIGDVRPGDQLIGWERSTTARPSVGTPRRSLCYSEVLASRTRRSSIVRVEMESGRTIRCTPDHRWLNALANPSQPRTAEWCVPKVGRTLLHVIDEPAPVPPDLERTAAWLGGIYDGEGSGIVVAGQSNKRNPEIVVAIRAALDALGFAYSEGHGSHEMVQFVLNGGRQSYLDFLHAVDPVRRTSLMAHISGWRPRVSSRLARSPIGARRFGLRDRIVAVEPAGESEVISLTTSSGNYIAWGYASRNCDDEFVQTAMARDVFAFAPTSYVEHLHPHWRKAETDATYAKGQRAFDADRLLYEARRPLWAGSQRV